MSRTDEILRRIGALHPDRQIDLGLDRILRLLEVLGNPHLRLPPIIHVAGTNGKGSTIAFCRAFLEAAGKRVHVYSSPHLIELRETIVLAGTPVSAQQFNAALEQCETLNQGQPITVFEFVTAATFHLFAQAPADFTLVEVGLGGRTDATNVIQAPLGTIITPVSIDHEDFLGKGLGAIAAHKAGILKQKCPAVIARQPEEAERVIAEQANRVGLTPHWAGQEFDGYVQNGRMVFSDEEALLDLPLPALAGGFQIDNATLAIAALRAFGLNLSDATFAQGMTSVRWPARLMPIRTGHLRALLSPNHELWVDGGHNASGALALAAFLADMDRRQKRPLVLIFGAFANKDAKAYLSAFSDLRPHIITQHLPGERPAWSAHDLAPLAKGEGLSAQTAPTLSSALGYAAQIADARVVICGSLTLAGLALKQNGTAIQ